MFGRVGVSEEELWSTMSQRAGPRQQIPVRNQTIPTNQLPGNMAVPQVDSEADMDFEFNLDDQVFLDLAQNIENGDRIRPKPLNTQQPKPTERANSATPSNLQNPTGFSAAFKDLLESNPPKRPFPQKAGTIKLQAKQRKIGGFLPMPPPVPQASVHQKKPHETLDQAAGQGPENTVAYQNTAKISSRVFTGTVNNLIEWSKLGCNFVKLFVTVGKFEWTIPKSTYPSETRFVIGDHPRIIQMVPELEGKPLKKLECVYYDMDEPMPNIAKGSIIWCFGRFIFRKAEKITVFQCIKLRLAEESDFESFLQPYEESMKELRSFKGCF